MRAIQFRTFGGPDVLVRAIVPGGVDAALDAAGGGALPALIELAGGAEQVLTIADYAGAQATGARFSGGPGTPRATRALGEIAQLIESGRFSPPVAQTFPLDRVGEAQALSQTGHVRGKLVLLVDQE
jgi:NADPH:quinone reductase-like Zn-dependent oxidoreductase